MKKSDAVKLFGSQANLARAIGFERQNVSAWPETLTHKQELYVLGAGLKAGFAVAKLRKLCSDCPLRATG